VEYEILRVPQNAENAEARICDGRNGKSSAKNVERQITSNDAYLCTCYPYAYLIGNEEGNL
jgi:hypothetical protein